MILRMYLCNCRNKVGFLAPYNGCYSRIHHKSPGRSRASVGVHPDHAGRAGKSKYSQRLLGVASLILSPVALPGSLLSLGLAPVCEVTGEEADSSAEDDEDDNSSVLFFFGVNERLGRGSSEGWGATTGELLLLPPRLAVKYGETRGSKGLAVAGRRLFVGDIRFEPASLLPIICFRGDSVMGGTCGHDNCSTCPACGSCCLFGRRKCDYLTRGLP